MRGVATAKDRGWLANARSQARARALRSPLANESGQAVIEFALTLIFAFGLLFFFIQLAMILAWGNFVQYATFMSARAYQSGGPNGIDEQKDRARRVIVAMVKKGEGRENEDRLPMIAQGVGGDVAGLTVGNGPGYEPKNYSLSWLEGVRYTFRSRLFLLPLGKESRRQDTGFLTLTSESWLGRDAPYGECMRYMQKRGIIDNGC